MRSGKVRCKTISGWLREERVPHSNLFCDWLLCNGSAFEIVFAQFGEELLIEILKQQNDYLVINQIITAVKKYNTR